MTQITKAFHFTPKKRKPSTDELAKAFYESLEFISKLRSKNYEKENSN